MSEHERLGGFLDHMEWADALMWRSVRAIPVAQRDERLIALLHHLHQVQWIYLDIWRCQPPAITDPKSYASADAVEQWARPYYAQAAAFIDALDEAGLAQVVEFPWADQIEQRFGAVGPATMRETIAQILLHTAYHRAQVATRVRELGGEPALTDYIAWIWINRPRASWQA